MSQFNLDAAIQVNLTASAIVPSGDYQVLAVDVFESWAGVFRFQVSPNGEFDADTDIAQRDDSFRWESTSSGGWRGTGWPLPWTRPEHGWDSDHLLDMGLSGRDVEDADETLHELIAVCGFASALTTEVRVSSADSERMIVPAPTGAFVAIALGRGDEFVELTPMNDGSALSRGHAYPRPA